MEKIKQLTEEGIKKFKNKGYSFEEVKGVIKGIDDFNNGKIYTQEEVLKGLEI